MSLLYRTGNGRNNIAWGGSTSTAATYLRRISTGRNDISYISISSNGTYNILNRTSTGRNNISWINTTFNFGGDLTECPLHTINMGGAEYQILWGVSNTTNKFSVGSINRNGYTGIYRADWYRDYDASTNSITIYYQNDKGQTAYNEILKYTKVTIAGTQNSGSSFSYTLTLYTSTNEGARISVGDGPSYDIISLNMRYSGTNPGQYPRLSSIIFS